MVLLGFFDARDAGSTSPTMVLGGTWAGTWTLRASCIRGTPGLNSYKQGVEIYTAPISGSPSGTVTYQDPLILLDAWIGFKLLEVSGQHASPIGLSASPSPLTSTSTFNTDLGSTPTASSLVVGLVHDENDAGPLVSQPSGWTEADEQAPAWGAVTEWAYKNGSSIQSPQWSGFTNSAGVRILGCALEILAAAAGGSSARPNLMLLGVG